MVTVKQECVEFEFFRPQAREVYVVGDFNDWQQDRTPMERLADGHWRVRLSLPGGVFRFRYHADGEWFTDYAAFGIEPGPAGIDSVVLVPEQQRALRAAA